MSDVLKKPAVQLKEEKQWPDAPSVPEDASELNRLTYPPGLVGHAVQYMVDTARLPDRWMALGTAMPVLAKGIDRKVIGPTGCSNVSYNAILAATGAGKQHQLNCGQILLRAMGVDECYRAGGIASVQSIEQLIEGGWAGVRELPPCPNALLIIDEFGAWLVRITARGQGGNISEIPGLLNSLWAWPPENVAWKGSLKVGKEVKGIYCPAFTFIGFSTAEKFFAALKRSDAAAGFMNRLSIWNAGRGWQGELQNPAYPWTSVPKWFGEALKKLTNLEAAPLDEPMLKDDGFLLRRDFHRLRWGDGAEAIYREFEKGARLNADEEEREIWARAAEIATRNATVIAFFRGSETVDVEDFKWAVAVVVASTNQLQQGFKEYSKEDLDQADLVKRLREQFKRKIRLTRGQIRKHLERSTNDYRKIEWTIKHLEESGDIALDNNDGRFETRGRHTDTWRWLRTWSS
jgi:hypothetical protein